MGNYSGVPLADRVSEIRASSPRALLTIALMTIAAVAVFAAVLFNRLDLVAIGVFLCFLPWVFFRAYRKGATLDFFSPEVGFPTFYVAYLFIGTLNFPVTSQFNIDLPWTQWVYYSEGLAFYLLGTTVIKHNGQVSIPLARPRFWNKSRFFVAIAILLALGLAGRAVKIAMFGIPLLHPENQELRVQYAGGYSGTLALALEVVPICLVLFLAVCKPARRTRWFIWVLLVILAFDAMSGDSRGGLMRIGLATLIVVHYARSRLHLRSLIIFGLVAVIFVSVIGTYRDLSIFGDNHIESLQAKGYSLSTLWLADAYESLRVTTEGLYMLMQQVGPSHSYTYGATSLAALAIPLPGHRPGPGEIVKQVLGMDFVGFGASTTILGPLYLDGGWVAIAIGMFAWGMLAKSIYIKMVSSQSYFWLLAYSYFVQNQLKAIKDEMFPELGPLFAILFFAFVSYFCGKGFLGTWNSLLPTREVDTA